MLNLESNDQKMIVENAYFGSWSPDGKKILFYRNGVAIANSDGSDIHILAEDFCDDYLSIEPPLWQP